jgi:hypothetical protein
MRIFSTNEARRSLAKTLRELYQETAGSRQAVPLYSEDKKMQALNTAQARKEAPAPHESIVLNEAPILIPTVAHPGNPHADTGKDSCWRSGKPDVSRETIIIFFYISTS